MTLKLIFKQLFAAFLVVAPTALLADTLEVEQGFVRAMPASVPNSAAYMTLKNPGQSVTLVSVSTDAAKEAQLHTLVEENGLVKMRQVEGFNIPAKGELTLAPSGDHIMLLGLSRPLTEGEQVSLTLHYADGSTQLVQLPVKKQSGHDHHHHHH